MRTCLICGQPSHRLHPDYYGAGLDDHGQFCSVECEQRWHTGDYQHRTTCQCLTCLRVRDEQHGRIAPNSYLGQKIAKGVA